MSEIHHTPNWYRDHCKSENCNPILRKKLKEDCRYIGGDPDGRLRHIERIEIYETRWSEVMNDPRSNGHLISEMGDVMERELSREIDRYNRMCSEMVD
jgi:hypothetical protein